MLVPGRLTGSPKVITNRSGAGASTTLLDTDWTTDTYPVGGLDAVKLRIHHAQSDSTSIALRVRDGSATTLSGAGSPALLSVRQSANQGSAANAVQASGPNAGGHVGAAGTVHVFLAADEADDVIFLSLGGTVAVLEVQVKRTGGTLIAGNNVAVEITPVEG